jgi:hypothetical protein
LHDGLSGKVSFSLLRDNDRSPICAHAAPAQNAGSRVPIAIAVNRRQTGTPLALRRFAVKQGHFSAARPEKMTSDLLFSTQPGDV